MRIIGPPSASVAVVAANLRAMPSVHERFTAEMLSPLWGAAMLHHVDPVGVIAQAYKETGGGSFTGKVKPQFYNTCGLKVRHQGLFPELAGDLPLAHQMFPNWETGARAHVQHLRAYAGWPIDGEIVDPRYSYVLGKHRCESFAELGGKWAPAADYGQHIEDIARRLQVT